MSYDVVIVPSGGTLQWVSGQTVTMKQIDSGVELSNYNTGQTTRFSVDGTNGQIFSIVDDLTDSLMSVNNVSGLPILEVFANNKVVMGTYASNTLIVSGTSVGIGTEYPTQKFVISGGTIQIVNGNQGAGKFLASDANGVASWQSGATGSSGSSGSSGTSGINGSSGTSGTNGSSGTNNFSIDPLFYYDDSLDRLYTPNLTIGSTGVTEILDVMGNVNFNTYQAIAMSCHSGTTLPTTPTPVVGQWFLHNTTGRKILYQHNGTSWQSIISLSALTYYVSGGTGTDSQSYGYATGTNAFRTIQYAIDQIPPLNAGAVIINIEAGTYSEQLVIQGKAYTGNYTITLHGPELNTTTYTISGTTTSVVVPANSSAVGSSQTYPAPSTFTQTGAGWTTNAYIGYFVQFGNTGAYYPICKNTTDTITFNDNTLYQSTFTGNTFKIYMPTANLTGSTQLTVKDGQLAINVENIKFNNSSTAPIVIQQYATVTFTNCWIKSAPVTAGLSIGTSIVVFTNSYIINPAGCGGIVVTNGRAQASGSIIDCRSGSTAWRMVVGGSLQAGGLMSMYGSYPLTGNTAINSLGCNLSLFNQYFDSFLVGVQGIDNAIISYQVEKYATFINTPSDIVRKLTMRNSNLIFTINTGTTKMISGYDTTGDYNYFNYGSGTTNRNIAIDNAGNVTFDKKVGIGYTVPTSYLSVKNSGSTVLFDVVTDTAANVNIVNSGVSGGAAFTMTDWGTSMKTQWNFKSVANTGQFKIRDLVGGQDMVVFEQSGGTNTIYIKRMNALGAQPALGYVGIGTSNPTALVTISGQTSTDTLFQIFNQAGYNFLDVSQNTFDINKTQRTDFSFRVEGSGQDSLLYVDPSNNIVGINMNTPRGKLDVNSVTSTDGPALFLQKTNRNSDPFISFSGATSGSTAYNISTGVGQTSVNAFGPLRKGTNPFGWVFANTMLRINVNGTDYWIPLYSVE